MNLEDLKDKLEDETFSTLESYINDLLGQRDQARSESISGRKGLKEKVALYESQQTQLLERLGVESIDDIEELPDVAGMAEAGKQFEAKVKRLERQVADTTGQRDEAIGNYRKSLKRVALADAFDAHDFLAKDVVSTHVGNSLVWEDDELLFKTEEGNLVSVKDGVAGFAKSRPELLKPTGAGGAGVRPNNARGGEGQLTMTRAEFEAMPPEKQMENAKAGVVLQ